MKPLISKVPRAEVPEVYKGQGRMLDGDTAPPFSSSELSRLREEPQSNSCKWLKQLQTGHADSKSCPMGELTSKPVWLSYCITRAPVRSRVSKRRTKLSHFSFPLLGVGLLNEVSSVTHAYKIGRRALLIPSRVPRSTDAQRGVTGRIHSACCQCCSWVD